MNRSLLLVLSLALFVACGKKENSDTDFSKPADQESTTAGSDPSSYDPKRGEGKFDNRNLPFHLHQKPLHFSYILWQLHPMKTISLNLFACLKKVFFS